MSRPDDDGSSGEGFLNRWSRRKQAALREAEVASAQTPTATPPAPLEADKQSETTAEAPPLPSLDDIVPGSDVKAFFQPHVPEALRTAALRKMWVTDPVIKDFIEIAENQYDFTNPDSIPGWSSTLAKVDVDRLVSQFLGGGMPQKEPTETKVDNEDVKGAEHLSPDDGEPADDGQEPKNDIDLNSTTSSLTATNIDQSESDVAAQHFGVETATYEPVRRRHGGALPT